MITKFIVMLVVLNLLWAIYNYFAQRDFYILISAIIYAIGFGPVFLFL